MKINVVHHLYSLLVFSSQADKIALDQIIFWSMIID